MIFREFAVDPAVMVDFYRCAYVLDQMGLPFGRLISGFPKWKDWKDLVNRACKSAGLGDMTKKRILHRVERAKSKFVSTDRLYRKNLDWIVNVRDQYPARPFDVVITLRDEERIASCLVVGEFFEDHPLWDVPRGFVIERTATAMAQLAGPLVHHSRELVFVDPYFDPSCAEWRAPFSAILTEATRGGRMLRRCEFHLKVQRDRAGAIFDNPTFEELCQRHLSSILPRGVELSVVRWDQIQEGEKLHPRYVLTEHGGLAFEVGLDEGKPGETTDVTILDRTVHEKRLRDYGIEKPAFREMQRVVISAVPGDASR